MLAGGDEGDTLNGRGGVDQYFGETGDDVIEARDNTAERISCGAGTDEADNDFTDIIAECERGIDADRDGFSSAVDCNDTAPNVFPGAPEVFDNGVDENCDGRDNQDLDVDRDGFPFPFDCDDGNAAIRPTTPEIRGNAVDENCDRRADPFADLGAVVANQWVFGPRFSRLRQARRPQRARGRARDVPLPRPQLPDATDAPRQGPQRALPSGAAPPVPARPLAPGDPAAGDDHRRRDDRPHLHLRPSSGASRRRRPGSSAARQGSGGGARAEAETAHGRASPRWPRRCSRRQRRARARSPSSASTLVYNGDEHVDQIAGFDTGTSLRFTRFGGAVLGGDIPCQVQPGQPDGRLPEGRDQPRRCSRSARATTSPR